MLKTQHTTYFFGSSSGTSVIATLTSPLFFFEDPVLFNDDELIGARVKEVFGAGGRGILPPTIGSPPIPPPVVECPDGFTDAYSDPGVGARVDKLRGINGTVLANGSVLDKSGTAGTSGCELDMTDSGATKVVVTGR